MLIATDEFELDKIIKLKDDEEKLNEYILSLVPQRYRHVDAIYRNTRYYINVRVLQDRSLGMPIKKELSARLTKGLRVVGYLGEFVTCKDLESRVSLKKVNKYYEGEHNVHC